VVLDVMLPVETASPVVSELRGRAVRADAMLRRRPPRDVLEGFGGGRRRLSPKPFELSILIARIRVRCAGNSGCAHGPSGGAPKTSALIPSYSARVDSLSDLLEVHAGGKVIPLTLMEASILRNLIDHEGRAVSRKSMLQEVWGLREDTDTRAIDNFIVRLRRYVEDDPARPRHLVTVRGIGYRFVASP